MTEYLAEQDYSALPRATQYLIICLSVIAVAVADVLPSLPV